jgi:hypothetical protein
MLQLALFGFMTNLASHLERSPLIHSYGYASAGDRSTCFASLTIKSKSFMHYAGSPPCYNIQVERSMTG